MDNENFTRVFTAIFDQKIVDSVHEVRREIPRIDVSQFMVMRNVKFPHYKYMKKFYAERYLEDGELRIGTIYDFSDVKMHSERIGDDKEGARAFYGINNIYYPIFASVNCINAYTFCVSSVYSPEIAKEFSAESVIQINSVEFYLELTRVIANRVDDHVATLAEVLYLDDKEVQGYLYELFNKGVDLTRYMPQAARTKTHEFSSQFEVRAIWEPRSLASRTWPGGFQGTIVDIVENSRTPVRSLINKDLRPFTSCFPDSRKYCKVYDIF